MATADDTSVSFDETDSRRDEMHETIDAWLDDLATAVDDAQASERFQHWLDVQSAFHDYSISDAGSRLSIIWSIVTLVSWSSVSSTGFCDDGHR